MRNVLFLTALNVVLFCGCAIESAPDPAPASEPHLRPPAERAAEQAADSESRGAPERLEELTLDQALELADRFHPELVVARARVEAAEGRAVQAGLFPNPQAVARMESAPISGSPTGEAEYPVGLSQRFPLGRRLSAASRVEELDRDRLLKEFEARRLEIRARVHGSFAAALYLQGVIDAQADAMRIGESGAAAARARLAAGDVLPEEVARAEMELLRTRIELERARSLREQALAALLAAMGRPTWRLESLAGPLDAALEVPTLESLSSRLAEHPLLASAEADVAVQRARVELAEAQRIPDVNLELFYRRLEHSEKDSFDVGFAIPIPLFDRNQGRWREASADLAASEGRASATRNELILKLQESRLRLANALAGARILKREVLPRADTVLQAAEARYSAGDANLDEVLPVRRDHTAVRLAYLEALRNVMEAWASLSPYVRSQ
ncbi:MAG: TolC family protein [Planctomycetes bacterium]|nr:TolC family protein [Planctomycetota bacterium]